MGLFIHSNLESILFHKRLTELERTSEIATGLLVLKQMLDQGQRPANRFDTLATLERLLPFIPEHQRDYVLDQIVRPLLVEGSDEASAPVEQMQEHLNTLESQQVEGGSSDFEVEYQIMIAKGDHSSVHESSLLHYKYKKQKEADARQEKVEQRRVEQQNKTRENLTHKLEKHWNTLNVEKAPTERKPMLLKQFLIVHRSQLIQDHPLIQNARAQLNQLESKST
jgi:hypothetical protein